MSFMARDAVRPQIVKTVAANEQRDSGILTYQVAIPNCATFTAAMEVFGGGNGFDPAKVAVTALPLLQEAMCVRLGRWAKGATIELDVPFYVGQQLVNSHLPIGERLAQELRIDYAQRVIDWAMKEMDAACVRADQFGRSEKTTTNSPGNAPTTLRLLWD
jgi:hypothetical protein